MRFKATRSWVTTHIVQTANVLYRRGCGPSKPAGEDLTNSSPPKDSDISPDSAVDAAVDSNPSGLSKLDDPKVQKYMKGLSEKNKAEIRRLDNADPSTYDGALQAIGIDPSSKTSAEEVLRKLEGSIEQ